MTDIRFYHMTRKTLERALPELLVKALERYPRILVKTADADQAAALDTLLWTYEAGSFMPHSHVLISTPTMPV
jgi:DNA polymerase-3 subunit chi